MAVSLLRCIAARYGAHRGHRLLISADEMLDGRLSQAENLWPPIVPTVVLAESTSGTARTDTNINRFLKTCDVEPIVAEKTARRAGYLRASAGTGSAVDALVTAIAEPGGTVVTGDIGDLEALAAHAQDVVIESV